jgi:hypothetical protein
VNGPCRESETAIQQEAANLVDQCCATLHQSIPNAVHGLDIELLLALDLHKTHVLLGHGFGDCLGIDEVIFVRLPLRLHKLCGDESHLVSLPAQHSP